ncbi:MAG: nucleotidyltransferase domain-containing protein [Candidatus Omnitrophica bacterium]|nr:nucleotidyltransferase domain-containing protein [bacterium]MCL4734849.1 nucleotidyltransferase domain-containing protein [Candidatus Omnitrophota bacterium]NUP93569.1 nucleotidyltransferase domain-containing protein [Candidatus Omnitrophota bacterium]
MAIQIELDKEVLQKFCQKWHIKELSLFGSVLREDFGPDSDVDFLVSFMPNTQLDIDSFLEMKAELEDQLGRRVDLVQKEAIRNPWKKSEILETQRVIYAS